MLDAPRTKKFSVIADGKVRFVHLYTKGVGWLVQCQSGLCRTASKARQLKSILDMEEICPHLKCMKDDGFFDEFASDLTDGDEFVEADGEVNDDLEEEASLQGMDETKVHLHVLYRKAILTKEPSVYVHVLSNE